MKTSLSRWNPLKEMEDLQKSMNPFFVLPRPFELSLEDNEWMPSVDVAEDDKEFTITADLPDVPKEQVHVFVDEGMLTIQGERKREKEEKKKKYHRIERSYGSYSRSFQLPEMVEPERIDAAFDNGVLTVHLPKRAGAPEPRKEVAIH